MKILKTTGTVLLLTVVQIVAMMISTQLIEFGPAFALSQEEASQALPMLFISSFTTSFLILYFFRNTNNRDYKILFILIYIWFGLADFLPQTDTWYFMDAFPLIDNLVLIKLISMALVNIILISTASFFIISRKSNEMKMVDLSNAFNPKIVKYIFFISVIYVFLYYHAGYFIAWQFEAIRLHYSGTTEILPFFEHTFNLISDEPYFFPFQLLRGALWFIFGIPLFVLFAHSNKEYLVYSFFIFAVLPTIQLLLPNPLMPEAVRMGHIIETFISNGIFGVAAAMVWQKYASQFVMEKLKNG